MNPKLILCLALVLSLRITNHENVTVADPLAEYGAGDLISGKFLSTAELLSWRYLLMQGTNAVGAMELNADKKRAEYLKFLSLGKSRDDNSELEAIRIAEQLPQVKKQDYELRCLGMMPYASAIWLHGESNDIIIPLPDDWKRWNAYQPYSEGEMIKLLKPIEDERIKMWKKYPGLPD